ncbi:MAG: hypothetical protein HY901_21345 [Deltaproteobacteria bacterium]|nr:hypothetical protein [Deltaproteobacteria bacterium]
MRPGPSGDKPGPDHAPPAEVMLLTHSFQSEFGRVCGEESAVTAKSLRQDAQVEIDLLRIRPE